MSSLATKSFATSLTSYLQLGMHLEFHDPRRIQVAPRFELTRSKLTRSKLTVNLKSAILLFSFTAVCKKIGGTDSPGMTAISISVGNLPVSLELRKIGNTNPVKRSFPDLGNPSVESLKRMCETAQTHAVEPQILLTCDSHRKIRLDCIGCFLCCASVLRD